MILLKLLAIAEIFIGTVNSENSTEDDILFTTINGRDAEEGEFTEDDNLFTTINVRNAEEGEFTEDDNVFTTINGRDTEEGEFAEVDNFRRIIGGRSAYEGEIPYQVQFHRSGKFLGSGSIIDKYHILTVAHYFKSEDKRNITVVGGVLYKYDYDTPHSFVRECSEIYVHAGYKYANGVYYNDIGICRLYGGLRHYTKFVKPISLNRSKPREQRCIVSGWGSVTRRKRTYHPGGITQVNHNYPLQIYNPYLLTENSCRRLKTLVPPGAICSRADHQHGVMCEGEGGDPIVCDGVLMGVAAYTFGCRTRVNKIFYMDVYYFIPWIENIIHISNKEINKFS